ncbi:MAG: alcohol dehydrogenase catalytic domain-containing protein [Bacteriovoracaceae bacterium]|jgi:threonine dehydrogenase-like Zn-dependent dehydrogenase|nr:alcohol dehydrogenase catalytic domain-containing protein [Bacteriovoracaceae bacterium]
MKALVFSKGTPRYIEVDRPIPTASESLIRVTTAGICNTDLEIMNGYMEFSGILGHEFVGVVVESSDSQWIDKRVVCDINFSCRECAVCLRGDFHHCPTRSVMGIVNRPGCFSEYICVPTVNLVEVPSHVSDRQAVFVEPLAAALEIQQQVEIEENHQVCVLGDGKLGLLIAMSLAANGKDTTLLGHHPDRSSRLGPLEINYVDTTGDRHFDLVIEATGCPKGLEKAISITKPKGTIVLKSTYANSFLFNPAMVVINELSLIGSRCGPFEKAVEMLSSGKLNPTPLIDQSFSLTEGTTGLKRAAEKGTLKVLLEC